jgi:AcrR family transcriptional regulator
MDNGFQSPGGQLLSQTIIDDFKRQRVAAALSEIVCEVGLQRLSVTLLTQRAKIARNTFYELFGARGEAFDYALALGNGKLRSAIDGAVARPGSWKDRVEAAIAALIEVAETEPALVELCLVHGQAAAGAQVPFDRDLVQTLAGVLRPGRAEGNQPEPPPSTEELLAYGILAVIAERLRRHEAKSLQALDGELTALATAPFFAPRPPVAGSGGGKPR